MRGQEISEVGPRQTRGPSPVPDRMELGHDRHDLLGQLGRRPPRPRSAPGRGESGRFRGTATVTAAEDTATPGALGRPARRLLLGINSQPCLRLAEGVPPRASLSRLRRAGALGALGPSARPKGGGRTGGR
jgi:hypothetical protein